MHADFYRQFEDQFRASRESIKARLSFYQPFLATLQKTVPERKALDLGCGRGEWLEILMEQGFAPRGVDLDAGMLQDCQTHGLPAEQGDALEVLRSTPDASLALISAFHVIEHIPFEALIELVFQAHRALVPGGLLILETPNPENISVGTSSFYLDPTHSKPIPHALLAFVTQYGGFGLQKILRLNEPPRLANKSTVSLSEVFYGVSPDYAVLAVKSDGAHALEGYQTLFAQNFGLALETLADRYDESSGSATGGSNSQLAQSVSSLNDDVFALTCRLDDATAADVLNREQQESMFEDITARLEQHNHAISFLHQEQIDLHTRLESVYRSRSWRITRPLRIMGRIARSVRENGLKGFVLPFVAYANATPQRRARVIRWLDRFGLKHLTLKLLKRQAISEASDAQDLPIELQALPPSAREIDTLIARELSARPRN